MTLHCYLYLTPISFHIDPANVTLFLSNIVYKLRSYATWLMDSLRCNLDRFPKLFKLLNILFLFYYCLLFFNLLIFMLLFFNLLISFLFYYLLLPISNFRDSKNRGSMDLVHGRGPCFKLPPLPPPPHPKNDKFMYQSNQSFNIPPTPRAYDVLSCLGGREFD